jgi:hypothetical protein
MKYRSIIISGSISLLAAAPAFAQHRAEHDVGGAAVVAPEHSGHKGHAADGGHSGDSGHKGYEGMQARAIKALSEQQLADLRAGKGMSLALPAELNGYPGPSHTLELAGPLALSGEQRQQTQHLFTQMQADAKRLGEQVIAREQELDRLFGQRKASVETVQAATQRAAQAQGELRAAHLRYHLTMMDVLSPTQLAKYKELRGYN